MARVAAAPAVSVVIPAYNAEPHLRECLDSVRAQALDVPVEVLVVDDGSTDRTSEIASRTEGVRLLRSEANGGPAHARNEGVAAARGEFVAFLDADDLWPPGSLQVRLDTLRRHAGAALVFGDCRQFDAAGPRARTLFESEGLGAASWGGEGIVPDAYLRLVQNNFITTGSVLARRVALTDCGGFDERLRLVEDLDLWLRLARTHELAWCATVSLLRRRHDRNTSRDAVAMSLAFLDVLERQPSNGLPDRAARALRDARAREMLLLADMALARRDFDAARRWAASSARVRMSLGALRVAGSAMLQRWARAPRSRPP
jgi:glycosyltransferase involved in cell wall biosynthesis